MQLPHDLKLLLVMLGLLVAVGLAARAVSRDDAARGDAGAPVSVGTTAPGERVLARKNPAGAGERSPESLPRSRRLTLERRADGGSTPGSDDDVVLLNNQGYNYP